LGKNWLKKIVKVNDMQKDSKESPQKESLKETAGETHDEEMDEITINPNQVFPVYILHRVVYETVMMCKKAMPKEAIGILLGFKRKYNDQTFVTIVDWVTGEADQSHAFAKFTPEGVRQYTTLIDERYGESEHRPRIVGIIHSHPFGSNPHFSSTDYDTFLNFPYDAEHNIFILVDPKVGYYKTYRVIIRKDGTKDLEEVAWVEYTPK
jgi:proteasome lid subunit RPN8/RPN11